MEKIMSHEIYDIFAADERANDAKTPAHEKNVLKSEIERITGKLENRLEAPADSVKRAKPKM